MAEIKQLIKGLSDSRAAILKKAPVFSALINEDHLWCAMVAKLVPPCEIGDGYHGGTSTALDMQYTPSRVEHIVVLVHFQCGGI